MPEPRVDQLLQPVESVEAQREEALFALGKFYELIDLGDNGKKLPLFAGSALFAHRENSARQKSSILKAGLSDIDICTDTGTLRELEQKLKFNQEKLRVRGLKIVSGEIPPLLGKTDTLHLECTIQPGKTIYPVDVFANFDASGVLLGVPRRITLDDDIGETSLRYVDEGKTKDIIVPVFKPRALLEIYRHLSRMQEYYSYTMGLYNKNRLPSMGEAYAFDTLSLSSSERVERAQLQLGAYS